MVVSLLIVLFGILAISGTLGDADSYGGDSPYDSGYASFGGDYYTYSVNNTAETTSAVNAVASNLRQISDLLRNSFGLFMMGFGLLWFCCFGVVYTGCISLSQKEENDCTKIETEEVNQEAEMQQETTEENL